MNISFPMLAQIGPEPPPPNFETDGPEPPPAALSINQFLVMLLVLGVIYAGRKFYLKSK